MFVHHKFDKPGLIFCHGWKADIYLIAQVTLNMIKVGVSATLELLIQLAITKSISSLPYNEINDITTNQIELFTKHNMKVYLSHKYVFMFSCFWPQSGFYGFACKQCGL